MNVFIINQCSTNKGDRAVLFFVVRELARNGVDQITVSTSNPEYWKNKTDFSDVNVRYIPYGWDISRKINADFPCKVIHRVKLMLKRYIYFPVVRNALITGKRQWYLRLFIERRFFDAVRHADLVISTGGHHLTTIIAPDAVYPQTFDMAVAEIYGKAFVLWSQSIGTFDFKSPKNRLLVKKILSSARAIYVRNKASVEEIRGMGVSPAHVLETYESVFGLYDIPESRDKPSEREPVMGVSVYSTKRDRKERDGYAHHLAGLANHAIEVGYKVRFFPMELAGEDRSCIEAVIESVDRKESCEIVEGFPSTPEHLAAVAKCKMFVGHKTHSVIFSLVAGTPVIAIAYHQKTEDFMAQAGLSEYCISNAQFDEARLIEIFDRINSNLDSISQREQEMVSKMDVQVRKDFAKMIEQIRIDEQ